MLATLSKEPVLTDAEVNALRGSNRELAAIGRNLNQIARALNVEFRDSDKLNKELIDRLLEQIDGHRDKVSNLIDRNMNRWGG